MKFNKTTILKAKVLASLAAGLVVLGPIAAVTMVCKYTRAAFHAVMEYIQRAVQYLHDTVVAMVEAADLALADHLDDELDAARQALAAHNKVDPVQGAHDAAGAAYDAAFDEYQVNHELKQESLQEAVASAITQRNAVR